MDTLRHDLAFALRMLRKSPIFTAVAVCAIALGSAAVTTIYSVVNTILLESSPGVRHGERLVSVQKTALHGNGYSVMGYPLYRDLRDETRTLASLAAFTESRMDVGLGSTDAREAVSGLIVSGNYFDVLGVQPAVGRFFLPEEDRTPLSHPVAVISYRMWADRFARSASVVGQRILIQATPFTIVGVAPEGFNGTTAFVRNDIYVPIMMVTAIRHDDGKLLSSRPSGWLTVVGRMRDGLTRPVAQAELSQIARDAEHRAGGAGELDIRVAQLRPIPANGVMVVSVFMTVLMSVAALVLMIASINVASMLLARGIARRKEFAVRLAIGASRARLVRLLLTESVLLFVLGGAAGVLLTIWITRLATRINVNVDMPLTVSLPVNGRVLAFTLVTSLVTGILFGLVPALNASRRDLATVLRSETAGSGSRRERTRSVFVIGQLAMSVLLLVCAGLFVRAFEKGRTVNPGFDIDDVVVAPISLANAGYDDARARAFYDQLTQRLAARPDVEAVSDANMIPLSTSVPATGIDIPGVQPPPRFAHIIMPYHSVGPDYFRLLRVPLLQGRVFNHADTQGSAPVAVVTEKFAQRYFATPGRSAAANAIGKTFSIGGKAHAIVGVVGDGRFSSITDEPEPFMFLLDAQDFTPDFTLFVRARSGSAIRELMPAIEHEVRGLDPLVTKPRVQTLAEASSIGLLPQRIAAGVTATLGVVGLLLAALGLYGVVAYGVNTRTREIGIRMALGADAARLVKLVLADGVRLVAIGTAFGMVIAMAGSRVLSRFLFGVSPLDPVTLLAVPAILATVAIAASWIPARRAAGVSVANALRAD